MPYGVQGEADTVVFHGETEVRRHEREPDLHLTRLGMADDIGESFLDDTIAGKRDILGEVCRCD